MRASLFLLSFLLVPDALAGALMPRASTVPKTMSFYYICPPYTHGGKTILNTYTRGAFDYDTGNFGCLFYDSYTYPGIYTFPGASQGIFCLYNNAEGTLQSEDDGSDAACSTVAPATALRLTYCHPTCALADLAGNDLVYFYWRDENQPTDNLECLYGYDPDSGEYNSDCFYNQATGAQESTDVGSPIANDPTLTVNCPLTKSDTCATGQFNGRRAYRGDDNFTALMKKREARAATPTPNTSAVPLSMLVRSSLGKKKRAHIGDF